MWGGGNNLIQAWNINFEVFEVDEIVIPCHAMQVQRYSLKDDRLRKQYLYIDTLNTKNKTI